MRCLPPVRRLGVVILGTMLVLAAGCGPASGPVVEGVPPLPPPTYTPTVTATAPLPSLTPEQPAPAEPSAIATTDSVTVESSSPPTTVPVPTMPVPTMAAALPGTMQNFELIGHSALRSAGWHGGLALAGPCAYVGNRSSGSVSIVDVGNPVLPVLTGAIPFGQGSQPVEVRTVPERNLLVVADLVRQPFLHVFDIADCRQPRLLATLNIQAPAHEFHLWQNGSRLLFFGATFAGPPDLIVVDLSDPTSPYEIGHWTAARAGVPGRLHSLTVEPDGQRAYFALWDGGFAVAELALPVVDVFGLEEAGSPVVWFPNTHSAVSLTDPRYVLLTSEVYGCPFGGVLIVDVSNPADPQPASSFTLPENSCDQLPSPDAVFTAHNPLVVGDLVFLSWYAGGLQVLDVSNPHQPQRVGQYVPAATGAAAQSYVGRHPVQTWSYPILRDGLIYVVDIQSGLHVVRYTGPGSDAVAGVARAEGNVTATGAIGN